ncbi:MAG: hypothetical protein PVG04_01445, partial [Anaerolineales bacterium]
MSESSENFNQDDRNSPDRENDLSAVEYIDRALEAAAANLCKELEYDLLEFNLLDISTGIFIPH